MLMQRCALASGRRDLLYYVVGIPFFPQRSIDAVHRLVKYRGVGLIATRWP